MGHAHSIKFTEDLFARQRFMKMDLTEFNTCKKQEEKQIKLIKYLKM